MVTGRLLRGYSSRGCGADHLTASSAEVKERVELYLFSPSEPSCPVQGELYLHTSRRLAYGLSSRGRRQIDGIGEQSIENVWT
jgi:hypothetical protein